MRLLLFITIYLTIYGGMHYYLYRRLCRGFVLNGRWRLGLGAFLVLMVSGPIVVRGLESLSWPVVVEVLSIWIYGWMGVLVLADTLFLLADIARLLVTLLRRGAPQPFRGWGVTWRRVVIGVMVLSVSTALYGFYAARQIHVETVTIVTDKLPGSIDSYRMVQLSDLHLGVMTDTRWLRQVVTTVNSLKPDLIVSTGDIIDSSVVTAAPYMGTLAGLEAPDGKYGVAGNHEFFAGIDHAVAFMNEAGFVMLRGEEAQVHPWLHLLGADDRSARFTDRSAVDHEILLMEEVDPAAFNILLKHQPVVREKSIGHFDLQLAGHVHQGQIFPFRLATWIAYPVAMGLSELGRGSQLYVSRGAGTWGPPIRVLAPPEITLFNFVHQ